MGFVEHLGDFEGTQSLSGDFWEDAASPQGVLGRTQSLPGVFREDPGGLQGASGRF